MTFSGIDNQSVELRITNYQYPEVTFGDWDGNWLNIYLNVKSNVGHWQTVDPSLTTWEVQEIIDWFRDLSSNKNPKNLKLGFVEPNLSFELFTPIEEPLKKFRIKFDLESRPQSATRDKEYFLDCLVDNEELSKIAADLEVELEKYPVRKPIPGIDDSIELGVPKPTSPKLSSYSIKQSIIYSLSYHLCYFAVGLLVVWSQRGFGESQAIILFSNLFYGSIGFVAHAMLFYASYSILKHNLSRVWIAMLANTLIVLNLFSYPFGHSFITIELVQGHREYFGAHIFLLISVTIAIRVVKRMFQNQR